MSDQDRLAQLRESIGEKAVGALIVAAKTKGKDPLDLAAEAVEFHAFLADKEEHGWKAEAVMLVRGSEQRLVSLLIAR